MPNNVDILGRQGYVEKLTAILQSLYDNKSNCTFAIDGKWGSGKTFILDLLEKNIEDHTIVIRYNAWENDFYEEPLIAILYTFANALNDTQKYMRYAKIIGEDVLKNVVNSIFTAIGDVLEARVGINPVEIAKSAFTKAKKESKRITKNSKSIDTSFNENANLEKIRTSIIDNLKKLTDKSPVVVFVDELDRCLPEYSIKVLERLHHLFNNDLNIQVIVSYDKSQLKRTVQHLFNITDEGDTINQYFKKFISFEILINEGNPEKEKWSQRFSEYDSKFLITSPHTKQEDVDDFIKQLFNQSYLYGHQEKRYSGMTIRETCQFVSMAEFAHNMTVPKEKNSINFFCVWNCF